MLPPSVSDAVSKFLRQRIGNDVSIQSFSSIGGGCINNGGKLKTSAGSFFVKWNDAKKYPGMFQAESKGLALLSAARAIRIPTVIGNHETATEQFIVMEFVQAAERDENFWEMLGMQLAQLHRNTFYNFGLDHDNYIGSLRQANDLNNSWVSFFIEKRLRAQLKLAVDSKKSDSILQKKFEQLFNKLPAILPDEKPALLHGDLWGGNLIVDDKGEPCLIDPAVYYGNREIELAFTRLFGGFDERFYASYNASFPLIKGFESRVDVYNLYPLLVHVNLFGGHYLDQVKSILKSIV